MARKSGHNKPYLRKGGGKSFKYKWGPFQDLPKDINAREAKRRKTIISKCNATPGSQGYDNKVTYTYNQQVVNGDIQNGAYVECNYVV
jgi:hypothetical protein